MIFSAARLIELCPQPENDILPRIALALESEAPGYGIDTLLRRSHFVAQIAHESSGFKRMIESLNYSAARIAQVFPKLKERAAELAHNPEGLGNAAYTNRLGNGDEASGDGFRYRGRGLIQLTGRDNYRAAGVALGLEMIGNASQAAEPEIAVKVALWFWQTRQCNLPADLDDVEMVTHRINGGINGLAERRALTERAKTIFTVQPSEGLIA